MNSTFGIFRLGGEKWSKIVAHCHTHNSVKKPKRSPIKYKMFSIFDFIRNIQNYFLTFYVHHAHSLPLSAPLHGSYNLIVPAMGATIHFCSIYVNLLKYIYNILHPSGAIPLHDPWGMAKAYKLLNVELIILLDYTQKPNWVNFQRTTRWKVTPKPVTYSTTRPLNGLSVPYSTCKMKPGSIFNVGHFSTLHRHFTN